ncbi:MAG: hypothetical protein ABJE10_06900 [bacterium]
MAVLLAGALLGPLALASCRSGNAYDVDTNQPDRILLNVKNDNFLDMDIYALSSGLPSRIGTVSGVNSAHFALDPTLYGASDFRIVATPIGGNGRASSGPLVVSRGQTIEFTIGSRLAQSHAEVR